MTDTPEKQVEAALMNAARYTQYPPTPDLAAKVARRLVRRSPMPSLARAAVVLIALFVGLFVAVPEIRAFVLSVLRIGAVTLIRETPTPAAVTPDFVSTVLDLDNETTLDTARASLRFPIALPAYPADLGRPDRVYLPVENAVTMVWLNGDEIRLVYTIHPDDIYVTKYYPYEEQLARVNGEVAYWLDRPHTLFEEDGRNVSRRIIHDHVLIWHAGGLTYRLETDLSLDEAAAIAESIR